MFEFEGLAVVVERQFGSPDFGLYAIALGLCKAILHDLIVQLSLALFKECDMFLQWTIHSNRPLCEANSSSC